MADIVLSLALEQCPVAVVITDVQGNVEYINPRFTQLTGYTPEEVIGGNPWILQSGKSLPEEYRQVGDIIGSGSEWQGEIQNRRKNGELYWAREYISSIKDPEGIITHFIVIEEDITEYKRIEEAFRESEERFLQVAKMTEEWIWEQDESGRYIYSSSAVKDILGYEPKEVIGKYYYELFAPGEREHWTAKITDAADFKKSFVHLINHYPHKDGHEVFTESTGQPIFDEQGRLIKWRGVDRDVTKRKEAEEMLRRAQVKLAVARNELKIARQIQESLLPSEPLILPEVHIVGHCIPAAQVGGDYFDYFQRGSDSVDVVIADVSGHSVGPALFMVEARSALRIQTHLMRGPADTLSIMNELLYKDLSRAEYFITMFYLQYNLVTRRLSYANAGHNPALLLRRGTYTKLDADGLILGVNKAVAFEEKTLLLGKGDIVFFYTDGITEAENPEGDFFGTQRLCELLTTHAKVAPNELIGIIVEKLQAFCQSKTFHDDVAMVVMKIL